MSDLARKIQEDLKLAFAVRNEEALGRAARTIADAAFTADFSSDVRLIAERMEAGFARSDQRFEQIDKRFEQVDKRFEETLHTMDKRFEMTQQSTDARFAELHASLNKQFNTMRWVGSLGFTLLAVLISIYQFIA